MALAAGGASELVCEATVGASELACGAASSGTDLPYEAACKREVVNVITD